MSPVLVTVVLDAPAAVALWARGSNEGGLRGPAFTITATVQRMVDEYAEMALATFADRQAALEALQEAFTAAHADLPSPDRPPESLIVVNLPLPANQDSGIPLPSRPAPALILAEDSEL